ncbi:MAG: hypothetical protein AAGA03_16710, partial [Planctomycetota bacterium]
LNQMDFTSLILSADRIESDDPASGSYTVEQLGSELETRVKLIEEDDFVYPVEVKVHHIKARSRSRFVLLYTSERPIRPTRVVRSVLREGESAKNNPQRITAEISEFAVQDLKNQPAMAVPPFHSIPASAKVIDKCGTEEG